MAAPEGNKNAVGNDGGRPPIYDADNQDHIQQLTDKCEEYFVYIKGEYEEVTERDEDGNEFTSKKTIRSSEYPTVTGLTLFLGFDSKSTLYEYSKKIEFSYPIKRALTRIEQYHEMRAAESDKCTGNIFVLKNFGWFDNQKVEQNSIHTLNNFTLKDIVTFDKTE